MGSGAQARPPPSNSASSESCFFSSQFLLVRPPLALTPRLPPQPLAPDPSPPPSVGSAHPHCPLTGCPVHGFHSPLKPPSPLGDLARWPVSSFPERSLPLSQGPENQSRKDLLPPLPSPAQSRRPLGPSGSCFSPLRPQVEQSYQHSRSFRHRGSPPRFWEGLPGVQHAPPLNSPAAFYTHFPCAESQQEMGKAGLPTVVRSVVFKFIPK